MSVPDLNLLLDALQIPFSVEHPADLTPSLLLAIFESIIAARLPIPQAIRQSRTRDAKSRAMLVLLGVLECDILRGGSSSDDSALAGAGGVSVDGWADDIGLGEVDPERLADGGLEETIFVGELLCWLARRRGILPRTKPSSAHPRSLYSNHHSYGDESADLSTSLLLRPSPAQKAISPPPSIPDVDPDLSTLSHITDVPRHPLVHSPEPSLSLSPTSATDLSIRARSVSSRTSVSNVDEASYDTLQLDPRRLMQDAQDDDDQPPTFRPRCIHELEDPSYIRALDSSLFDTPLAHHPPEDEDEQVSCAPPTPTPRRVRLTGWIEPVDADAEIAAFASSRMSRSNLGIDTSTRSRPAGSSRRRIPSPSPSPSPPVKHAPRSLRPTRIPRPPSPSPPPSPSVHSDTDDPFDVSFSTLNNTSTPAKPRPRAGQTLPQASVGGTRVRARSPSYTPSPPSFSTPSGPSSAHASGISRTGSRSTMGFATTAPVLAPGRTNKAEMERTSSTSYSSRPLAATKTTSTITSPPLGSTARTNTLLTERARLLTELAALKRARSVSGGGAQRV